MKEADAELEAFGIRCEAAFQELFDAARAKDEIQFALSLIPEMRGMQDHGWSTAVEARKSFLDYVQLLEKLPNDHSVSVRVGLSFYANLSEASGLYEVPKNMLRTVDGEGARLSPFHNIVSKHRITGESITPNASKVMKDIIGHSTELGFDHLVEIIKETFDFDLRNGYAHADYILLSEGIRLPKRNGGQSKMVSYDAFAKYLSKAMGFFNVLHHVMNKAVVSYTVPRTLKSRLSAGDPEGTYTIAWDPEKGLFGITGQIGGEPS